MKQCEEQGKLLLADMANDAMILRLYLMRSKLWGRHLEPAC
jgi:hypothetical protein